MPHDSCMFITTRSHFIKLLKFHKFKTPVSPQNAEHSQELFLLNKLLKKGENISESKTAEANTIGLVFEVGSFESMFFGRIYASSSREGTAIFDSGDPASTF